MDNRIESSDGAAGWSRERVYGPLEREPAVMERVRDEDERVESGDGGKCEQGHSDWKSRGRPRDPAHSGWAPHCQSADRHLGNLARQGHRRAQGKDRVASRRDLQRGALQGCRAVSEEGRQGLYRGRAADPEVDRPVRRREVLDRSGAAGVQLDADHAGRPVWRRRRWRIPGRWWRRLRLQRAVEQRAASRGRWRRRRWRQPRQQRHGRRDSVLRSAQSLFGVMSPAGGRAHLFCISM